MKKITHYNSRCMRTCRDEYTRDANPTYTEEKVIADVGKRAGKKTRQARNRIHLWHKPTNIVANMKDCTRTALCQRVIFC